MSEEKCCCNCLHCARWSTSKGIECHCDLTDRYLGYLEVMNTDNDCCRWEKETKWDLEKEHDKQIRADEREKVLEEYRKALHKKFRNNKLRYSMSPELWNLDLEEIDGVAEQLKEQRKE